MVDSNGTMLATVQQQQTGLTVYDRVDPMDFIEKMGKVFALSAAGGCKNENEGKLMALACLSERKTIFEIARRYHLMAGKLVLKAETMLGDFRRAGGKHKWLKDGSDGQVASLELIDRDGNKLVSTFTFATAVSAGYVKDGSQWKKRPDQMLRSRAITDGIRMIAPEISSGEFVEEEADDFSNGTATTQTAPARSKEEVAARRAELQATATASPTTAVVTPVATTAPSTSTPTETIVDVEPEKPPFDVEAKSIAAASTDNTDASTKVLMEIELTIKQAGLTVDTVINAVNKKNGTAYKSLDDLPEDSALTLLTNLQGIIRKKQEAAATGQSA